MTRENFMKRVRDALHHQAGEPVGMPPAPFPALSTWERHALAERFTAEATAVGATVHRAADLDEAKSMLARILSESGARSFIATAEPIVGEVLDAVRLPTAADPALADVGLSGVRLALADTGTLALDSGAGRKPQLLPMTYVALLRTEQLRPSLTEALAELGELPSALVLVTGPSRTADIELTLTTGVHGPGVVHIVLIG